MSHSRSSLSAFFGAAALGLFSLAAALPAAAQTAVPQLLPYFTTAVAGGAATSPAAGAACATGSTLVSTDAYGDGCLATQVALGSATASKGKGPQFVTSDDRGNVFFSDTSNGLVRRVDARSGIITTVAGGATASPAAAAACGTFTSQDVLGDGCLATAVKLTYPEGIAFSPTTGELFFSDSGNDTVRKITANGTIQLVAGSNTNTFGYATNSAAGNVVANTSGYLNFPYGIAFTTAGNLIIADEGNNAILGVNLGTTTVTIANVSIPAGTIAKLMGIGDRAAKGTSGECPQYTSATARGGCYFGSYTEGAAAIASATDNPYDVSVDPAGNIYFANEFLTSAAEIRTDGTVVTSAGVKSGKPVTPPGRGPATTTPIGSDYGLTVDNFGNQYVADSSAGLIWRVDAIGQTIYVIAGGGTACATATDTFGDNCPALQTKFSPIAGGTSFASVPGVQGLHIEPNGNLLAADSANLLIRRVSTNTRFPATAINTGRTQTLLVHYGVGDTQGTYSFKGYPGFTAGTAACTVNSDTTQDCLLPLTFTPTVPGLVSAPLLITSTGGRANTYTVTGLGSAAQLNTDTGTRLTLSATLNATSLTVDSLGNTYATVSGATTLTKINTTGAVSTVGTALTGAVASAVDPLGNIFVALPTSVVEIPVTGAQTTIATGFTKLAGITVDPLGNVYVSDSTANSITLLAAGTFSPRILATGLSSPAGLALDSGNNLFVANLVGNNIAELPASGGAVTTYGTGLSAPSAIAIDAAGSVYVADTRNARIVYLPNENGTLNAADQIVVLPGLVAPAGVALTPSGSLLVADSGIFSYTRSTGTIAFGNDAIGTQVSNPADVINDGNLASGAIAITAAGNTADFTLTPSSVPTLAPGFGANLTAGFKPTAAGQRAATYTLTSAGSTALLTLTGNGIVPATPTVTTITANPTTGTYGQTVTLTFTVTVATGPVPTGTVKVLVDTTPSTLTLTNGTATLTLPNLGAGSHTITAQYTGDNTSNASTANPVNVTLAKAPLTIAINSATKVFGAANPTFTGTVTGAVLGDQIGVSYSTTATATSAPGTYPITATLTGTALANYSVTQTAGTLTVTRATTTVALTSSLTSTYNTPVILTATITTQAGGLATGTITFFNGATAIGTVNVAANAASTTVTFTITGQSTTNVLTAVYSGDTNFAGSTSPAINVVSSFPGFALTGVPSATTPVAIAQGQTALLNFTITPTFGYAGSVTFSCTGLPATVGCVFSPSSITSSGSNTASLIALSITTQQPNGLAAIPAPSKLTFALLPGLALLIGLATRRRRLNLRVVLMLVVSLLTLIPLSGCSTHLLAGTTKGTYTIMVTATGTPSVAAPTTTITQSFPVTITVQ